MTTKNIKIGIIISLLFCISATAGIMMAVFESYINSNIDNNIAIVYQYTCSGKLLETYENCHNINEKNGITTFNLRDQTDDINKISIKGGIIKIGYKEDNNDN